jgi:DNA-binding NtrC family response regulator
MASVIEIANKVARKPVTVLITGESGTGKEVLARYLHGHSERCSSPFVAVNLPAIPSELVESTLFGHEKGSFTGATRQAFGKFELANGGTLFLDEVGNLKLDVQAKLLRALQEREIERVGSSRLIPLDLRVICASNRSLPKLVQEGVFREDLYWRLKVVPIELPPLRARREDIPDLARYFLGRFAAIYGRSPQALTEAALEVLTRYSWPGNIRELENLMERLVVVCDAQEIDPNDLPLDFSVVADLTREVDSSASFTSAVASFEKAYLRKVLRQNNWHRRRAAEQLGIGYSTLKSKLKAYGLVPAEGHDDEEP